MSRQVLESIAQILLPALETTVNKITQRNTRSHLSNSIRTTRTHIRFSNRSENSNRNSCTAAILIKKRATMRMMTAAKPHLKTVEKMMEKMLVMKALLLTTNPAKKSRSISTINQMRFITSNSTIRSNLTIHHNTSINSKTSQSTFIKHVTLMNRRLLAKSEQHLIKVTILCMVPISPLNLLVTPEVIRNTLCSRLIKDPITELTREPTMEQTRELTKEAT